MSKDVEVDHTIEAVVAHVEMLRQHGEAVPEPQASTTLAEV